MTQGTLFKGGPITVEVTTPEPRRYAFFVAGEPRGKGSKTAFPFMGKDGKPHARMTDSPSKAPHLADKLTTWNASVTASALAELGADDRIMGPVSVAVTFYLARPMGDFKPGTAELRKSAPRLHTKKPDLDKLERSTLDALKVGMLADDSRIWRLIGTKRYVGDDGTRQTGAWIVIEATL